MAGTVKGMVSIVIVNHSGKDRTLACLASLATVRIATPHEVLVVDNDSSDGSVAAVRAAFPEVRVLPQERNRGFGAANNAGAMAANGEYLFLVNNDTLFASDVVTPLRGFLATHAEAGAAGPRLLNPDGSFQRSFGRYPSLWNEWRTKHEAAGAKGDPEGRAPRAVDWLSFAAVMIPRRVFDRVGGFDERYFMYFEDVDMCRRMREAGCRAFYCPEPSLVHIGGASWTARRRVAIWKEYRKSQLLYYGCHRSALERLALRCYLTVKFILVLWLGRGDRREAAASILSLVWSGGVGSRRS
jgi:GT2 family glycosyltransferase